MNHEEARALLHDYVDGVLSDQQRQALEARLQSDAELQRELTAIRDLLAQAAELPESIEPERDLWSGIAAAIAESEPAATGADQTESVEQESAGWWPRFRSWFTGSGGSGGSGSLRRPVFAAVAICLVLLLLVVSTRDLSESPVDAPAGSPLTVTDQEPDPGMDPVALAYLDALDLDCPGTTTESALFVAENEDDESSPLLNLITHNLRIIDLAIADVREAWSADPDSPHLARLLASAYRARAVLQRQETRVVSRL
ncbi:MAG: hypothetical protein ABIF77_16705 [bacterium]